MVRPLRDASLEEGAIRGTLLSLEKCGEEVFGRGIELLAKGGSSRARAGCRLIDGFG